MKSTTRKKKKKSAHTQTYMQSWLVDLIGEAELLVDLNGNDLGGEKRRKRERESMIGKNREMRGIEKVTEKIKKSEKKNGEVKILEKKDEEKRKREWQNMKGEVVKERRKKEEREVI